MPSQAQKMLASAGYWQRLGLTPAEVGERMADQYPYADEEDIASAISLAEQLASAGSAVQFQTGNLPVYGINLPIVPGQGSPFEYRALVPIFDPETERESEIMSVIRSPFPLTYSEIEERALADASMDISKAEYDKAYRGLAGFQPDVLTPNATRIVSASVWEGPRQYMVFGT